MLGLWSWTSRLPLSSSTQTEVPPDLPIAHWSPKPFAIASKLQSFPRFHHYGSNSLAQMGLKCLQARGRRRKNMILFGWEGIPSGREGQGTFEQRFTSKAVTLPNLLILSC
ncbi:unnamed protein product [Musa acuminata subsp. burmannicoides]